MARTTIVGLGVVSGRQALFACSACSEHTVGHCGLNWVQWDDLLIVSSTAFRVTLLLRDEEVFSRLRIDLESATIDNLYDIFPAPSPWLLWGFRFSSRTRKIW